MSSSEHPAAATAALGVDDPSGSALVPRSSRSVGVDDPSGSALVPRSSRSVGVDDPSGSALVPRSSRSVSTGDRSGSLSGQAARWAGQRDRRRAEFVEAALGVIAEQGPGVCVEDIAVRVGVARTRLYRHFTDKADLERAINARVAELVVADLEPLWHPHGSARQMITGAIGAYVGWLNANRNLHEYLRAHVDPLDAESPDGYPGVRRAVAEQLTRLFGGYLDFLGVADQVSADLAWAVVGMVESVAARPGQPALRPASGAIAAAEWPDTPAEDGCGAPTTSGPGTPTLLIAQLADWTWAMLAAVLADVGIDLDPDLALPPLFD